MKIIKGGRILPLRGRSRGKMSESRIRRIALISRILVPFIIANNLIHTRVKMSESRIRRIALISRILVPIY
ncbi:hypothetical protein [Dolichospermum heterosporum]|uniref:Transposase n=1 Tax=Dolichospermum heterosporum TAC447 TaxID=747523 RepID=A0ABY5LP48_9CYAN|nr:hypothetical protein [Dolichospermum heterosporum]UUO13732.1 hypothetical protein NG743_16880 [Dolichospermum heterosporum TAC447]